MELTDARAWLVAYDVRSPKRLQRVHRWMVGQALAVQYSVFLGIWNASGFRTFWMGLEKRIDRRTDDVRAYPLPSHCRAVLKGRVKRVEGTHLVVRGFPVFRLFCEHGVDAVLAAREQENTRRWNS